MFVILVREGLPEDQGLTLGIHKIHTFSDRIIFTLGEPDADPKEVAVMTHKPHLYHQAPWYVEMGDLQEYFASWRVATR